MALHRKHEDPEEARDLDINPVYVQVPDHVVTRDRIPEHGMLPDTALQVVRDELILDGNARLNLATFVTTWMEPQAERLMTECLSKNMIDKDEYPETAELERRCVSILAHLWHAPSVVPHAGHPDPGSTGCSTTGSSEACMLGGMALLWRWRARRAAAGAPDAQPNLVMGANVQVCWDKFCRYWQVEPRQVPMEPGRLHLTGRGGGALRREHHRRGRGPRLHHGRQLRAGGGDQRRPGRPPGPVRGGRAHPRGRGLGGFVAPFLQPDLMWDFRVRRVASINSSGHKYGLVYPGVGWVIWRDAEALPEDLVFKVNYLGGQMPTFALNFSRSGSNVVAQYYNFLRLGFEGYRRVQQACQDVATYLAGQIGGMGPFELLSDGTDLPVLAFRLRDPQAAGYTVFDVSERLRQRGWLVPAYTFPANMTGHRGAADRGAQRLQR